MHPQFETGIDHLAEDHAPPATTRRRLPVPPAWLTRRDTWLAVVAAALATLAGVLWAVWWVLSLVGLLADAGVALADGAARAGRWLSDGPITSTVTDPVRAYLDQHAAGLPATAGQLWWTWLAVTTALFVAAWCGSRGARLGWTLIGAVTAAMVWAGAAPTSRDLAAGVAVAAWSLLSVPAFTGTGQPRIVVVPASTQEPEPVPAAADADAAESPAV